MIKKLEIEDLEKIPPINCPERIEAPLGVSVIALLAIRNRTEAFLGETMTREKLLEFVAATEGELKVIKSMVTATEAELNAIMVSMRKWKK